MPYTHLTHEERYVIFLLNRLRFSRRAIAQILGRSPSTISREMRRNRVKGSYYGHRSAQKYASDRRANRSYPHKIHLPQQIELIEQMLRKLWSPEIIAKRLPKHMRVSHQTIYTWLERHRPDLKRYLWLGTKRIRKHYGSKDSRGVIPDRKSISERPLDADERKRLGDWEGDTLVGARHKGSILSLVDRRSRYCMLTLLPDRTSQRVSGSILNRMNTLPKRLRRTLTVDNGKEFTEHQLISKKAKLDVYFADAYASWQRGSNEQLNKLVRRWIPKKTDFRSLRDDQVAEVEYLLNNRPRKCLGYLSPAEFLIKELGACPPGVALQT